MWESGNKAYGLGIAVLVICLLCCIASVPIVAEELDLGSIALAANRAYDSGDWETALPLCKQLHEGLQQRTAFSSRVTDADTLIRIGRCYEYKKMGSEARTWYGLVLTLHADIRSNCLEAQFAIAESLERDRLRREAWVEFDKVTAIYPTEREACARALLLKGRSQAAARKLADALLTLNSVSAMYPDQTDVCTAAKVDVIETKLRLGQHDKVYPLLKDLRESTDFSHEARARFAVWTAQCASYIDHDQVKAEEWYTKAIEEFGDTATAPEAYLHRGLCRLRRQAYDGSIADIEMIKNPMFQEYARGMYSVSVGNLAQAAVSLEKVMLAVPQEFDGAEDLPTGTLKRLADIYDTLKDAPKAASARQRLEQFRAKLREEL